MAVNSPSFWESWRMAADRAYLSIVPIKGHQPLTEEQVRSLVSVLGVALLIEFAEDGRVLLGFPPDRFRERELARGNLEMALHMEFGDEWRTRFQVLDS